MKKITLFLLIFLCGVNSFAAQSVLTNIRYISKYTIGNSGTLFIYVDGNIINNPATCDSKYAYALPVSHPQYDRFYGAILSSYYSGNKMGFLVSGTTCTSKLPTILSVRAG